MNRRRVGTMRILAPCLLVGWWFWTPGELQAQSSPATIQPATAEGEPFSPQHLESYRTQLTDIVTVYGDIADLLQDEILQTLVGEALAQIEELTAGDLEMYAQARLDLRVAHRLLLDAHQEIMTAMPSPPRSTAGGLGGLTEPNYSLICGSFVFPTEVVLALKLVSQILKIQWQGINRICQQSILGENTALLCIPIDVVLQIAIFVLEDLTFCNSDVVAIETRTTFQRTEDLHIDHTTLNSKLNQANATLADVNTTLVDVNTTLVDVNGTLGAPYPPNLTVKSELAKLGGFDPALSFTIESALGFSTFDPALGVTVKSVLGDFDPPSGVTVQSVLGDFDPPAGITVQSVLGDFDPLSGVTVQSEIAEVQNTLDTVIEHRRVHLQVIELKQKERYLLATDEAGVAVDVELVSVSVSDANTNQYPITFVVLPSADARGMNTGTPGLLDVRIINLPFQDAKLFEFRVVHDDGDHRHFGTILFTIGSR